MGNVFVVETLPCRPCASWRLRGGAGTISAPVLIRRVTSLLYRCHPLLSNSLVEVITGPTRLANVWLRLKSTQRKASALPACCQIKPPIMSDSVMFAGQRQCSSASVLHSEGSFALFATACD